MTVYGDFEQVPTIMTRILIGLFLFLVSSTCVLCRLTCYCEGSCPHDDYSGNCTTSDDGFCFSSVRKVLDDDTNELVLERNFGCLGETALWQCKVAKDPELHGVNIICCNTHMCNTHLNPVHVPRKTPKITVEDILGIDMVYFYLIIAATFAYFLCTCVPTYYLFRKANSDGTQRVQNCLLESIETNISTQQLLKDSTITSESGNGERLLSQRTVAKQLEIIELIGKGRYSEVWLAKWRDNKVAVKMYPTQSEASWQREVEINQTIIMRHKNILGFIASDIKTHLSQPYKIIITDYHEQGSLHDYLQHHVINVQQLKQLTISLASGLCFLHTEINGKPGKISVAHRDLTSKNILVKNDDECVIGDFGLAGMIDSITRETNIHPNERLPTIRYMAPEVLSNTMNMNDVQAYLRTDIYSLGLIFWEMCRRCVLADETIIVEDYLMPYEELIPDYPSIDAMKKLVCTEQIRPLISDHWDSEEILEVLSKLMQECWKSNPDARLTAQNVKKKLIKLQNVEFVYDVDII